MNKYEHISKMEDILNGHQHKVDEIFENLNYIENHKEEYKSLIEYYYSEQRNQDLKDEENNLIPKTLNRGVLSEDAIYNLMTDYYDLSLKMLEVAAEILKR